MDRDFLTLKHPFCISFIYESTWYQNSYHIRHNSLNLWLWANKQLLAYIAKTNNVKVNRVATSYAEVENNLDDIAKYLLKIKKSDTSWQHHIFLSILHPLANLQCVFFSLINSTFETVSPHDHTIIKYNSRCKNNWKPRSIERNRSYPTKEWPTKKISTIKILSALEIITS